MNTLIHTFGGNVGVGTDDPGSYSLSVLGTTKADSLVVNNVTDAEVKIGLISMWYGLVADIPDGWALCNGQTVTRSDDPLVSIQTPNLTTRFIIGAFGDAPSPASPGQIGGANSFTMSVNQLPQHNHQVQSGATNVPHYHGTAAANMPHGHNTGNANANHNHNGDGANAPHSHFYWHSGIDNGVADDFFWGGGYRSGKQLTNFNSHWADCPHAHNSGGGGEHNHNISTVNANHSHSGEAGNANHTHPISVSTLGGTTAIPVTNPFYVLAFIMKY